MPKIIKATGQNLLSKWKKLNLNRLRLSPRSIRPETAIIALNKVLLDDFGFSNPSMPK